MSNLRTFAVIAFDVYYPLENNIHSWHETREEAEEVAERLTGNYDRVYVHDFIDDILPSKKEEGY